MVFFVNVMKISCLCSLTKKHVHFKVIFFADLSSYHLTFTKGASTKDSKRGKCDADGAPLTMGDCVLEIETASNSDEKDRVSQLTNTATKCDETRLTPFEQM